MNNLAKHIFVLLFTVASIAQANDAWNSFIDKKVADNEIPVITNRAIQKQGRLQLVGPLAGISERKDLHDHYIFSMGARYFFAEQHAWEVLRVHYDAYGVSGIAQDVVRQTGYQIDAQQASLSLSTGYLFAPIYGKYSFSDKHLIHFDGYLGASMGLRFATGGAQVTFEPVIGANHYVGKHFSIILPEVRARFYSEQRRSGGFVTELMVQAGLSWLF